MPSSLTWPRSHFFDGIEPPVANAGDLHISLRDRVDQNIVSMTVGSFGYDRFLSLGSTKLGDGWLLYAGEFNTYDGLWVTAEDVRKFSGLLRYSQGTPTSGFSATAMAYTSNWNSPAGFPQAQIGNAPGNFIPEAPWMVASAGITFGEKTGWSSALGWRYISSRPLTEDGVFQSPPLNTINANVGIDRIADAHSSFGIHLHSIAEGCRHSIAHLPRRSSSSCLAPTLKNLLRAQQRCLANFLWERWIHARVPIKRRRRLQICGKDRIRDQRWR